MYSKITFHVVKLWYSIVYYSKFSVAVFRFEGQTVMV